MNLVDFAHRKLNIAKVFCPPSVEVLVSSLYPLYLLLLVFYTPFNRKFNRNCQMHVGENIYILCGLLCFKCLEPRTTVSSTCEKTAEIMFKMDNLPFRSVLGDNEYVDSLNRKRLLPVSYFLVVNDLILLNNFLVGLTSMIASDHWSITFGCPKTRSSEKFFIEAKKNGNVLKIITLIE